MVVLSVCLLTWVYYTHSLFVTVISQLKFFYEVFYEILESILTEKLR